MQVPTLRNVHIRSAADAHKLFYAVQLGILPKIEKRLDANERAALRPGDVYVWEEKGPNTDSFSVSMERFTEGKSWTASRVREVRPATPFAAFALSRSDRAPYRTSSCTSRAPRRAKGMQGAHQMFRLIGANRDRPAARHARTSENLVVRPGEQDLYIKLTYSVIREDARDASGLSIDADDKHKKPPKWHMSTLPTECPRSIASELADPTSCRCLFH